MSIYYALAQFCQTLQIKYTDYTFLRPRYNSLDSVLLKTVKTPIRSNQDFGFYINPERLNNIDFLNFDLWDSRFFSQAYQIFGLDAAYIYFPTLLVFFWVFCFLCLGFISLERSRIVCLLLMLLCTALLLIFGYYWNLHLITSTSSFLTVTYDNPQNLKQTQTPSPLWGFINFNEFKKNYKTADIFKDDMKNYLFSNTGVIKYNNIKTVTFPNKLQVTKYKIHDLIANQSIVFSGFLKTVYNHLDSFFYSSRIPQYSSLSSIKGNPKYINSSSLCYRHTIYPFLWDRNYKYMFTYAYEIKTYLAAQQRLSMKERADIFLMFYMSIKSFYNIFNFNSLTIIIPLCFGSVLVVICGSLGLNFKVDRFRRRPWILSKFLKKEAKFERYKFRYFWRFIYRKMGGAGAIEYTSVEPEPFYKKIKQPANIKEALNLFFWIRQFNNAVYSRVPTTLIWITLVIGVLSLPANHIQWRVLSVLGLFFFCFFYFNLKQFIVCDFKIINLKIKTTELYTSFISKTTTNKFYFFYNSYGFLGKLIFFIFSTTSCLGLYTAYQITSTYSFTADTALNWPIYILFILFFFSIFFIYVIFQKVLINVFANKFYFNIVNAFIFFFTFCLNIFFVIFLSFAIFQYLQTVIIKPLYFQQWVFLGFLAWLITILQYSNLRTKIFYQKVFYFLYLLRNFSIFIITYTAWIYYLQASTFLSTIPLVFLFLFFYTKRMYLICMELLHASDVLTVQKHTALTYWHIISIFFTFGVLLCMCCFYTFNIGDYVLFLIVFMLGALTTHICIFTLKSNHILVFMRDLLLCLTTSFFICYCASAGIDCMPGRIYIQNHFYCGWVVLILWTWSFLRLGRFAVAIKNINFFLYWSLVIMPIVCSIAYTTKPLFFIHYLDKYSYLIFIFESLLMLIKFIKPNNVLTLFSADKEKFSGFVFLQSVKSNIYVYIYFCFVLTLLLIFACKTITPFFYFILYTTVSFLSFLSICIVTAITSTIRSGFFYELQGSLNNFRFLKKLFNIFLLISIFYFIFVIFLFFQI